MPNLRRVYLLVSSSQQQGSETMGWTALQLNKKHETWIEETYLFNSSNPRNLTFKTSE